MNIGIFFKHDRTGGGIYQYFLSVMESVAHMNSTDRFFLFYCHAPEFLDDYLKARITAVKLNGPGNSEATADGYEAWHDGKKISFKTPPCSEELRKATVQHAIDLMVFSNIERESFESRLPYLTALHDWTHRTHPQFAEFVSNGVYEQREYIIHNSSRDSLLIMADSQTGKEELTQFYGIPTEKIAVLPFIPPPYFFQEPDARERQQIKETYHLPEKFLFYPAQFWPHKNHANIIRALHLLRQREGLEIPALFTGSTANRWSSFEDLMALARELGLADQISYPGYIDSRHLPHLYALATMLVIPTFPGPTNIPILEAFASGCPVVGTDIPAVQEQTQGAALLVDPADPADIAQAISRLWNEPNLRRQLSEAGRERIRQWGPAQFALGFKDCLDKTKNLLAQKTC